MHNQPINPIETRDEKIKCLGKVISDANYLLKQNESTKQQMKDLLNNWQTDGLVDVVDYNKMLTLIERIN